MDENLIKITTQLLSNLNFDDSFLFYYLLVKLNEIDQKILALASTE